MEEDVALRRRWGAGDGKDDDDNDANERHMNTDNNDDDDKYDKVLSLDAGTYWLTRVCFLRSLGFIYAIAFLVSYHQNGALLGREGLLPADQFMSRVDRYVRGDRLAALAHVPTLFWLGEWRSGVDEMMSYASLAGMTLALSVAVLGSSNMIIMTLLWALYHSLVNVGQTWYSFGWESQLLETGFLAIWFVPLFSLRRFPPSSPPSWVCVWGYRWLIFRIMLGAGLIKIRGDQCWRDLTCMHYHYQTQPVLNPLSYYLHQSPGWWHRVEVVGNHLVELVVPFAVILGRRGNVINGVSQIAFQAILILSGNLSFLNWLTILPSICSFDDKLLSPFFARSTVREVKRIQMEPERKVWGMYVRRVVNISLALLLAYLSIPVVQNLLSRRQAMNTSFEPLRLVNTHGAFGRRSPYPTP